MALKANRIIYPVLMTAGGAVVGAWVGQKFGKSDPGHFGAIGALLGGAYGARGSIMLDLSRGKTSASTELAGLGAYGSVRAAEAIRSINATTEAGRAREACAVRRALDGRRRKAAGDPCWDIDKDTGCAIPGVSYAMSPIRSNPDYRACLAANQPTTEKIGEELEGVAGKAGVPMWAMVGGLGLLIGMALK
jgi:hypothetical protein